MCNNYYIESIFLEIYFLKFKFYDIFFNYIDFFYGNT